jgi:hypothetical protein
MAGVTLLGRPGGKDIIMYRPPAHASNTFGMYFKARSFPKGPVPEHLRSFVGQARHAPVACVGKKGQEYRACLMKETAGLKRKK